MINFDNIKSFFNYVSDICIYSDNKQYVIDNNEELLIIDKLIEITKNSHEMPALGVSIDSETRQAMTTGLWLELYFNTTMFHNDMPFDSLLIKVEESSGGFNLIRKHNNQYEGRCFYLNLNNSTMDNLRNYLIDITIKKS